MVGEQISPVGGTVKLDRSSPNSSVSHFAPAFFILLLTQSFFSTYYNGDDSDTFSESVKITKIVGLETLLLCPTSLRPPPSYSANKNTTSQSKKNF